MLLIYVLPSHNYFIPISQIDFAKQIFFIGNRNLIFYFFGNIDQNIVAWNDVSSDVKVILYRLLLYQSSRLDSIYKKKFSKVKKNHYFAKIFVFLTAPHGK